MIKKLFARALIAHAHMHSAMPIISLQNSRQNNKVDNKKVQPVVVNKQTCSGKKRLCEKADPYLRAIIFCHVHQALSCSRAFTKQLKPNCRQENKIDFTNFLFPNQEKKKVRFCRSQNSTSLIVFHSFINEYQTKKINKNKDFYLKTLPETCVRSLAQILFCHCYCLR